MNIPRWDWEWNQNHNALSLRRSNDGEYVRWADCERLLRRIEELQEAVRLARNADKAVKGLAVAAARRIV